MSTTKPNKSSETINPAEHNTGIIARQEQRAIHAIEQALLDLGINAKVRDLRPVPFAGTWGVATSVCQMVAGEIVGQELTNSGALADVSKKEARKRISEASRIRSQQIAEQVVDKISSQPGIASAEAINGYINISFNANMVAAQLIREVLDAGWTYGHQPLQRQRVMIEHSQPNTHKAFHVGHLRNSCLGIAMSRILRAAGLDVQDATYIGDIGLHVIKCLWCYEQFHRGDEPAGAAERGRWLGEIYAEADARLTFRDDIIAFLLMLASEDSAFVAAIDRLLKELWRLQTDGEDIAYLLGRFTHTQEIKPELLRQQEVIIKFWPIIGVQLQREVDEQKAYVPVEGEVEPSMTPEERLARWEQLNEHIEWWLDVPRWQEEIKETFQRWEHKDPAFVALWERTKEWSMADFRRIFAELEAQFDVWFFESEVEEEGRRIAHDLLEAGIAEYSDGLPVVKIDEKLGLRQETYRTMPILRSDGTTLYSTKDLALTRIKFEHFNIDTAIWVVDVRQSLYFQQIAKILELFGFEQARQVYHLGYEMVRLTEGVISSRKGNVPFYEDVRDQVFARAQEIVEEKNPELSAEQKTAVTRAVGLGSLKYAMLARDINTVVVFDLEEALSFDGHAAPYIQYAHARACRILDKAQETQNTDSDEKAPNQHPDTNNTVIQDQLDFGDIQPEELDILQHLAAFPDEVKRSAQEYRPLLIANYVYELAKRFNDFYHNCPVLQAEQPIRSARLSLVDATRQVIANGLDLLGIEAPPEM